MRVAIDARWIFQEFSGIGVHTLELIRELGQVAEPDEVVLLFSDDSIRRRTISQTNTQFSTELLPYGIFSIRNQWKLISFLEARNIDVFHTTNYMMPLFGVPKHRQGKVRIVNTIHDLIPLVIRNHAPRSKKARLFPIYQRMMREIAARGDTFIAVSEATKRDLTDHLNIASNRIEVVYNGVGKAFVPPTAPTADTTEPTRKGILYVGRCDPYKNLLLLIESFARVRAEMPHVGLHIIGSRDERYPEPEQRAIELGVRDAIRWDGYVTEEDLVSAYQQAAVLVMPSSYEGFGLPVAEAMACGTPVISARAASLPEIGGTAASYFDLVVPETLDQQLLTVLDSPGFQANMSAEGLDYVKRFSWANMAKDTWAIYNQT